MNINTAVCQPNPENKEEAQRNFCPNTHTSVSFAGKKVDGEDSVGKERMATENLTKRDTELNSKNSIIQMATHQGKWLDRSQMTKHCSKLLF